MVPLDSSSGTRKAAQSVTVQQTLAEPSTDQTGPDWARSCASHSVAHRSANNEDKNLSRLETLQKHILIVIR